MTRYRVVFASPEVYVIDTGTGRYWPERFPDTSYPIPFDTMRPDSQAFRGRVLEANETPSWRESVWPIPPGVEE